MIFGAPRSWGTEYARAQDDAAEVPGYREAIDEALTEYAAKNYLEAMTLFNQAHQLSPNARTLRGLGVVTFELHRYSESVSFLEQALASQTKHLEGTMRASTETLLKRARGFVAKLTIKVEPRGASVLLDGELITPTPGGEFLLNVGKHQLECSAPGYVTQRRAYTVVGGEQERWVVVLQKEATVTGRASSAPAAAPLMRWHKALGGSAVALGFAGLTAAAIFTKHRREAGDTYRRRVEGDVQYAHARQRWRDSRTAPYAFAGAGALALSSGAMALLLKKPEGLVPVVVASVSAAVGLGLAVSGAYLVANGGPCSSTTAAPQECSRRLERRDQGGITLLSAIPFLVAPGAFLLRRVLSLPRSSTLTSWGEFDPARSSISLQVRGAWL